MGCFSVFLQKYRPLSLFGRWSQKTLVRKREREKEREQHSQVHFHGGQMEFHLAGELREPG